MDEEQQNSNIQKKEIQFVDGNRAQIASVSSNAPAAAILSELDISKPGALIIISGGAGNLDSALIPQLSQLFSRGIVKAATETQTLIMDGGTHAGVMAMTGQAVADHHREVILLGIAPAGKVTYPGGPQEGSIEDGASLDTNHSHFVLVDGNEWGDETDKMFELAGTLAKDIPVVIVLVNGGNNAKKEILFSVRQHWPIIVVEHSGRLADEIAGQWKKRNRKPSPMARFLKKPRDKPMAAKDPVMGEIISEGDLHLFSLQKSTEDLKVLLQQCLLIPKNYTLKLAWERFALYDSNAVRQQSSFNKLQLSILALGVVATLLALSQTQFSIEGEAFRTTIIIMPITVSVLIAVANRFKAGNKWILLRAAAEAIKQQVYHYRSRIANPVKEQSDEQTTRENLYRKLKTISSKLMQTEVNLSALRPYNGQIPPPMYGVAASDDGFSPLTPDRYIDVRLGDQLSYYRLKTNKLERQLKLLQWLVYIFGGLGTLLAAVGFELWIALTTAIVGSIATFLEYKQVENSLMVYNQTATDLANLQVWWTTLPNESREEPGNFEKLVDNTEKILERELKGWVQEMQDALSDLSAQLAGEKSSPSIR
jgi:hypothetical protein